MDKLVELLPTRCRVTSKYKVKVVYVKTDYKFFAVNIKLKIVLKMVLVRPEENHLNENTGTSETAVKVKTPKRILHFSDGTLEEYSTDDEETTLPQQQTLVDPVSILISNSFIREM